MINFPYSGGYTVSGAHLGIYRSILPSLLPWSILTPIHSDIAITQQFLYPCQELGGQRFNHMTWPWIAGLSINNSSTPSSEGLHHLYPRGTGAAIRDWLVIFHCHDQLWSCVSSGVSHLCSFTSSYAYISFLHDDPGEGSMFKNYSDLNNFELGFVMLLIPMWEIITVETSGVTHA